MESLPFIDYVYEDKSRFPLSRTQEYIDLDNDFLIGESGGFLMNWNFKVVNTHKFNEVARFFENNNVYTAAKDNTEEYRKFWQRETERRGNGMVANCKLLFTDVDKYENALTVKDREKLLKPLRISGDHYNYLNYGRIMRTPTDEERKELIAQGKVKQKLIEGFPRYWDGDYWNFKVDEFIANNSFHLTKGKARRKGYSFKRGSQAANTINLNPKVTIILAAFLIDYLTDPGATADMLKTNLDWYENYTYWHRGYLSENLRHIELGYKTKAGGHKKFGYRSKALAVTARNNESCAIGKGAIEIDAEESGKFPNLKRFVNVTRSAMEIGATNVGTMRIYGTAGSKDEDWGPFADLFYKPKSEGMMPFENVWDRNRRRKTCGFFHPQVLNYEPYIDVDGNSLLVEAWEHDYKLKEEKKQNSNHSDYIEFVAQRANSPEEAFNLSNENIFTSAALLDHYNNVKYNEEMHYWRDGLFVPSSNGIHFKSNSQLKREGNKIHPYIENVPIQPEDDPEGCVRVYFGPDIFRNEQGNIPDNLLYGVLDPVGIDKNIKDFDIRNSLNAASIWTYPNNLGYPSDELCATYVGRTSQMADFNRQFSLMLQAYNAEGLAEVDRGSIVSDFRTWGLLKHLAKDPTTIINEKIKESAYRNYGIVIGRGQNKKDGLLYLKEFLYEQVASDENSNKLYRLHYINDVSTLLELIKWNEDGNFDRVSMLIIAMFQRLAYRIKKRTPKDGDRIKVDIFDQIGLYKNENNSRY